MRGVVQVVSASVLMVAVLLEAQAPAPDAASVLAAARTALGGEERLTAVKNFVATGRTKQVRGDNLVPIEFEISCELPDKYVRKDEIPAQESGPTSTGFNGADLIVLPVQPQPAMMQSPAGGPGAPPAAQMEAMRTARVATAKQDFVRLTLGMFAASFSTYPVTFTYAGQAEAPQGKADVLDVAGGPAFKMRLFINSQTHLPIMVSWQAPANAGRGMPSGMAGAAPMRGAPPAGSPTAPNAPPQPPAPQPTPAPVAAPSPTQTAAPTPATTPGTPPAGVAPPPGVAAPGAAPGGRAGGPPPAPVEYRVYYGDYREVNGLQWPFRLRRATGTETTEETTFDGFKINTRIDARKFEIRK